MQQLQRSSTFSTVFLLNSSQSIAMIFINQELILLFFLSNLIPISVALLGAANYSSSANSTCISSCGEGKFLRHVSFPFGFSADCEIQLNCTAETGQFHLVGFEIKNLTYDSILLQFPANCTRSISDIKALFGEKYAPSWKNGFLFRNCPSSLQNGCVIPANIPQSRFKLQDCGGGGGKENISCYAAGENDGGLLRYNNISRGKCTSLFSSFFVKPNDETKDESDVSLEFQIMQLAWWLPGTCQCAKEADCVKVQTMNGSAGFRCRCKKGFSGDGFAHGGGCRKDREEKSYVKKERKRSNVPVIVGGIIAGASAMTILAVICCLLRRRSISSRSRRSAKRLLTEAAGNSSVLLYPYKEIERATSCFSEKQRLGTGAYGTVYAGKFHNDEWVAIKRIKNRDADSTEQVMNEIKLLSSVSHPNLVRLIGCCIENGEQILVYEYMPNGTLSQHLQRERGKGLPWTVRLTVATETAQAIAYLHSAMNPPIFHRDIKSSNILLDYDYKSKVADFGLSRFGLIETSHISTAPQGTPGYVDPQYHQNFHLSDKSDVYSFGVVLVEILTAMKVVDFSRSYTEVNLAALAVDRIGKGRLEEIIDPLIDPNRDAWTFSSVHKVAELAFRCLAFHRDMRPSMMEVAEELECIRLSAWTTCEEGMCIGSDASSPLNGSLRSLTSVSVKKGGGLPSKRLSVPPKTVGECLASLGEVKDTSPVSVQEGWFSEESSPSANSLLSNAVQ